MSARFGLFLLAVGPSLGCQGTPHLYCSEPMRLLYLPELACDRVVDMMSWMT